MLLLFPKCAEQSSQDPEWNNGLAAPILQKVVYPLSSPVVSLFPPPSSGSIWKCGGPCFRYQADSKSYWHFMGRAVLLSVLWLVGMAPPTPLTPLLTKDGEYRVSWQNTTSSLAAAWILHSKNIPTSEQDSAIPEMSATRPLPEWAPPQSSQLVRGWWALRWEVMGPSDCASLTPIIQGLWESWHPHVNSFHYYFSTGDTWNSWQPEPYKHYCGLWAKVFQTEGDPGCHHGSLPSGLHSPAIISCHWFQTDVV